ncbi:MAG: ribonuclease III, partial [bacterium]
VAEQLFLKCPSEAEGSLTRIRASLVKGETLAELARELGMGQYLNLGSGELKSGGRRRDSILADALEALIGAIFLDSDMESAKAVVLSLYGDRIDSAIAAGGDKDAKTALQELLQSRGLTLPEYDIVETTGDPHERQFTVSCLVDVLEKPVSAVGNSKRAAEKSAARKALAELGKRGISYRG